MALVVGEYRLTHIEIKFVSEEKKEERKEGEKGDALCGVHFSIKQFRWKDYKSKIT